MSKKHALTFAVVTVLLDVIGFGIIMPVMPELLREISGADLAEASVVAGRLMVLYALLQFFFAPLLGNLSDRFGRRRVLLISLLAFGGNYVLMGFATTLWLLFVGRVFTGMASSTYSVANSLIADVTEPDERAQNFGLLGMAFGIGFILGPPLGGYLGEWDVRAPFYAAGAIAFLNFLYGFFFLRETLPTDQRRPFDWRRANPFGALMQVRRYPVLIGLLVAMLIYNLAHHVYPSNWNFYTIAKFDWSAGDIGLSMGFVGIMMALVQGGLVRVVVPRFGAARVAFFGFFAAAAAYLGIAFATNSLTVMVWCGVSALAGLVGPSVQAIMTSQVPQNEQGELQGIVASVGALAAIIGPLVMTESFAYATSGEGAFYFPGIAFAIAGVLTLVGAAILGSQVRRLIALGLTVRQ